MAGSPKDDARERALLDAVRRQFAAIPAGAAPRVDAQPTLCPRAADEMIADAIDAGATRTSAGSPLSVESSCETAAPGIRFAGYEVRGELSRGGQGVVYRATQQGTNRDVAIKVLLDGVHASPATRARFDREVQLAAKLRHPNIVTVFHSGTTETGLAYYVMDFVPGTTLQRYVRDRQLALDEVLRIFAIVADAVQYAHQRGVIHRDLKPANILIDQDGTPRILDFGLAKSLTNDHAALTLTQEVMGTLPYMSPEQTRGMPDEIDTRSDVYALGVILYELLTGRYPYPVVGSLVEVIRAIASEPPRPPARSWDTQTGVTRMTSKQVLRGLPKCPINFEVETIVLRALAKEAERRYQSAGDLAQDVRNFLSGDAIEAKRDSTWYRLRKAARKHYWATLGVAAVAVTILAWGGIGWWSLGEARRAYQRSQTDRAALQANNERMAQSAETFKLGWFLLALDMNSPAAARAMARNIAQGTVQDRAARYLLGEPIDQAQLLTGLTDAERGPAYFAIAERLYQRGEREAARAAFEDGLQQTSNGFWAMWMRMRLAALRGGAADGGAAEAAPGDGKDGGDATP